MNKNIMDIYDIIIIGGGPAGLGLAHYCSYLGNIKILVIEKEDQIGGCHRVKRVNGIFTEHGPRIYSSTYVNFINILKEINEDFFTLFTPDKLQTSFVSKNTIFATMSLRELYVLTMQIVYLIIYSDYGTNCTVETFTKINNFSKETVDMLDRLVRLLDGSNIKNYSLNALLQSINQQSLYTVYQPSHELDKTVFKKWKKFLESRNVDFLLDTSVFNFHKEKDIIVSCEVINKSKQKHIIKGKQFVIATPPESLLKILKYTQIKDAFGDYGTLKKWAFDTNYIEYISISFHWNKTFGLPLKLGFNTEWGITFVVLSDYTKFNQPNSKTVISAAVTIVDAKSSYNQKTANECEEKQEIINEVFRQLKIIYPSLDQPTISILNPNNYYDDDNKKWNCVDTAFVHNINTLHIPFKSEKYKNMYNLGTHNGKNKYKFTSLESAISNAMCLSIILYPELSKRYTNKGRLTVSDILIIIFIISIVIYFIYILSKCMKYQ